MLERLLDKLKYRLRIGVLSAIFLMVTTIISVIFLALPILFNPSRSKAYDIGSVIAGSIVGQVILLSAISLISYLMKDQSLNEGETIEDKE